MPEQLCGWLWSEYCKLSAAAESYLLKLAHDRRIKNKAENVKEQDRC
jgi:hypothetical protein